MEKLYENIRRLRLEKHLSQDELARLTGYKDRSSITKIESGKVDLPQSKILLFSKVLGVSPSSLMGLTDFDTPSDLPSNILPIAKKKFPLLGSIACGEPIFADEYFEGYVEAGANIDADFCLRANGDSMIGARIHDGDIVFIKQQPLVENGQIAAVLIDDEATLKRFYYDKANQIIQLMAENPAYPPIIKMQSDLEDIRILGRAIAFQSNIL